MKKNLAPRRRLLAVVLCGSALLAACGGSDDDASGGDDSSEKSSTTTTIDPATERPQGEWTIVSYDVGRSDGPPDYAKGNASVRLVTYEPTCDSGPCTIKVLPGEDGTFLPPGEPRLEGQDYTGTPYEMTWDEASGSYTYLSEPEVVSCTNTDGETIEGGYTSTTERRYTFRPPTEDAPAGLFGDRIETNEPTEAGVAKGCTPFTSTQRTAGTPTGEATADAPALAGDYATSWTVEKDESDSGDAPLPVGYAGLLGTWKLAGDGAELQLTATAAQPFPLTAAGQTWSGSLAGATEECTAEGGNEALGLWDLTESVTDLTPVALTEDGLPILNGKWAYSATPQPDARANMCEQASQAAMVTMVPAAALD